MNLASGTRIGRYEIRSKIGAGAMGEVYRAADTLLERDVAVKFLIHADDPEKLRRFRQEAKAVSALNHPNVLTVHEVGEYENLHYIVSELVAGENLRRVMEDKNLTLGEILDIGIQIGNALAAAHAVGIVHRDIKPENIMILSDGYIKVLDFGLAKFVEFEKKSEYDSETPTASLVNTKPGMILGTINYMSPEQVRGKTITEATDIWSAGVVLFELIAGHRPFSGDTVGDAIAAVLEHPLPALSEIVPEIPLEVENVLGKALEKNAENRFSSAREFVSALKNARSVSQSLNLSIYEKSISGGKRENKQRSFADSEQTGGENLSGLFIAGTKIPWRIIGLSAFLFFIVFGSAGWYYVYKPIATQVEIKQPTFRRLTTVGNITNAAISPDGGFVVYVQTAEGRQSIWLRQIDEASAGTQLIAPMPVNYAGLAFAPDGKSVYYTVFAGSPSGKLYRIGLLGGSPQEIAVDVDTAIAFAPDGKSFAFIRSKPESGADQIIISNFEGNNQRVLSQRNRPEFYMLSSRESLSFSPDGRYIACPFGKIDADGEFMSVAEIEVETGAERPLTEQRWHRVGRVVWTKENDGELLITAAEAGSEQYKIVKVFRRDSAAPRNITSELNDYYNLSLTNDSALLLGVSYEKTSGIFTASSSQPMQIRQTASGGYDGIGGTAWTADGKIIYSSMESGNRDIWMMDADGANRKQLTFDKAADDFPAVSRDGKYIVFVSSRTGVPHIWRMNFAGGELKQLTDKGGENFPSLTPDGETVVFTSRANGRPMFWKTSIEGGEPVQITSEMTNWASVSPDGKFIACLMLDSTPDAPIKLAVISAENGSVVKSFATNGSVASPTLPPTIRWTPDSHIILYTSSIKGVSNVWAQPLDGGAPKQITDFTAEKIFSFDWSKEGKQIVYARGTLRNDLILIENF